MRNVHLITALVATAFVSACAGDVSKPKIEGERIDIRVSDSSLKADLSAMREALILPRSVETIHWPQAFGDHTHYMPHVEVAEKVTRAWRYSMGGGSDDETTILNAPVVMKNIVFASNTDAEIYAINLETGKRLWDVELEPSEDNLLDENPGLAVTPEALFVTLSSGDVFALNLVDGEILWQQRINIPLRGAPSVIQSSIAVVAQNNSLHVLNQSDGSLRWTHNGLEERLALQGGASVAASEKGTVIVPYSSGEIYALELRTGKYLWHDALSFNVGSDPFSGLLDINASPVVADGIVYAVNFNGQLSAFHLETGRRLWNVPVSASKTPLVAGSMLYVVDDESRLIAINRKGGKVRWVKNLTEMLDEDDREEKPRWTGVLLAGERLFTASSNGFLMTLNPETGEKDKLADIGGSFNVSPVAVAGTVLFIQESGRIIAYR